jgi:hypothetical protein
MAPPAADIDLDVKPVDIQQDIPIKGGKPATDAGLDVKPVTVQEDRPLEDDKPTADAPLEVKPVESKEDAAISDGKTERRDSGVEANTESLVNSLDAPLKYSGTLDQYKSVEVTPVIGREYPEVQLSEILKDDEKIRDLAITGQSP